jgi:hypothetical protein
MKWIKDAKERIVVAGENGQGDCLTELSEPQRVIFDHLGQIYVADSGNHRFMCWCKGDEEGTIVIGRNGRGEQLNQLHYPQRIVIK